MKKIIPLLLALSLLCGCSQTKKNEAVPAAQSQIITPTTQEIPFVSRYENETTITLSDDTITCDGENIGNEGAVYLSHDIIYYEDKDTYESGLPYGEGKDSDKHSADEAAAHSVINITQPGSYRISGTLSAGQIRVDLGEDAYSDPNAVVELILDGADITCTVAPAVLFLNVYECDGEWSEDAASATVDTSGAGAIVVLAEGSKNTVNGSHVAKIYKDKDGEKKLWKQDAAFYSYMSMNFYGNGTLDITADNEGLDTELHLTINGGNINIRSQDDGINTNEDGVSVTTINAGCIHIIAGLGSEGDGIDSNGYLVINGGTVVSSAHPASDAGLDSDLGSYVNGGTVIALGSTMDWAESDSEQVTMNLQFAQYQNSDCAIVIKREDGCIVFAYDPSEDEVLGSNVRNYMGAVISSPNLQVGESYEVFIDGIVTGNDLGGIYETHTITAYGGGVQQMYTGTDVGMFGGFGGPGMFGGFEGGQMPERPNGMEMPDGFTPQENGQIPEMPEGWGENGSMPEGWGENGSTPEGWGENGSKPEGFTPPENGETSAFPGNRFPQGGNFQRPDGMQGSQSVGQNTENSGSSLFYMTDKVNAFSGVTALTEADN